MVSPGTSWGHRGAFSLHAGIRRDEKCRDMSPDVRFWPMPLFMQNGYRAGESREVVKDCAVCGSRLGMALRQGEGRVAVTNEAHSLESAQTLGTGRV